MKKRLLLLALTLCMALCLLPVAAEAAEVVDSGVFSETVTYTLNSDGTLIVSGTGDYKEGYW